MKSKRNNLRSKSRHRGMALVLVTVVMALAAVMGYAILSSTTLQATASSNGVAGAIATAQAESGISLAMYYLKNPANAPSLTNGYWPGASNITFTPTGGAAIAGSVTVTVSKASSPANTYTITSVGSSGSNIGGGVVTKTISAVVRLNTSYQINQAFGSNSALSFPTGTTIVGNTLNNTAIVSNKAVTIGTGASVTGNVSALSLSTSGTLNGVLVSAPTSASSPTSADLHDYTTYTYQGVAYAAQQITTPTITNVTLAPTASNPLGVYWHTGDLNMASNVVINGTLIEKSGKINVTGTGNSITPAANMPGLLVDRQLMMTAGKVLTVNGVVWAGQGVVGSGNGSAAKLTINGALFTDTSGITAFVGNLVVNYSSGNVTVPDLSSANQTPTSAQIVTWTP